MKLQKFTAISVIAVGFLFVSGLMSNAYAISSSKPSKITDFKLKSSAGKPLRKTDVILAIKERYKTAMPKITIRSGRPECFDAKFFDKGVMKRVSFNCTKTQLVMTAK